MSNNAPSASLKIPTAPVVHTSLPGGLAWTVSGGTRAKVNLSRPWQPAFPIDKSRCPFCTKDEAEVPVPGKPAGWRILNNLFSPHEGHLLVIPKECWDEPALRNLGGQTGIFNALEIVRLLAKSRSGSEISVSVHVGCLAGQNLGHVHWHVLTPRVQVPFAKAEFEDEVRIHSWQNLTAYAAGVRAGQCLFVAKDPVPEPFDARMVSELSVAFAWMTAKGNARFESVQGKTPEYSLGVRISSEGRFRFASYTPILNPWGEIEHTAAHLEGAPFTLPWPHAMTASHLRD